MKSSRYGAPAIPSPLTRQPRSPSATAARALLAALACMVLASPTRAAERQVLHGNRPSVLAHLAPVGRLPGARHLNLAITLPVRNQAALTGLLRQLYDPASPRYRQYLTSAQFTAQFGPSMQDYEAVAAFAIAHRLTVTGHDPNRLVLDVAGAVSDIENALHVSMRLYRHPVEARNFYAPDSDPSLDLGVAISHIGGLTDYSPPKPAFKLMPAAQAGIPVPNGGSGPYGGYMGADFRAAYAPGVSQTGTGQTVGLVQFDGYSATDITYYESLAGLPNVKLTNVLLDSFNGQPATSNGQLEVSLDIEMVISMAPGVSDIRVYEAGPDGNWEDILNKIASDNKAKEISCSWFSPGLSGSAATDAIFEKMAAQGQTFFCASGDSDAYTALIPFPEDNPYITLVGGTILTDNGTGGAWNSETAWNWNNGQGTGGGISTQYAIPYWQQATRMTPANAGSTTMRNVPDVALTASGVYVRAAGTDYSVGGTSCASPLWGAFTALANQEAAANGRKTVGFLNPALYALASSSDYAAAFHDIATGNNTSTGSPDEFYAVAGYDLCTGVGTPAGAALINALALTPDHLNVSLASLISSGTAGVSFSPVSTSFTLTNGTSSPVAWTASATQSWLSLSASAGTLAGSGSATVTASINSNANALATGTYSDTISFTDVATDYIQTRPVTLSVVAAPVITSATCATATEGQPFTYQIAASNIPSTYNATGLPSGLSVNTATGLISGTAAATGTPAATATNAVTISAINLGGTGSATLSLLVQTPYATWQSAMFTASELTNPAVSGAAAAPAGDNIPNLMKYALNLNPWTNGAAGLPTASVATTGSGNYLALTYTQVISAIDLTYTVQVSPDLKNWYSGAAYTTPPVATDNPGGLTQTVTVQALAPMTGDTPAQFIRLQVTGP